MTKKNDKNKQDNSDDFESAETEPEKLDQPSAEAEANASDSGQADSASNDVSVDDLLDDVRKSLIEDDDQSPKETKSGGWWGRRTKEQPREQEIAKPEETVDIIPEVSTSSEVEKPDEYVDQIDELIDMLDEKKPSSTEVVPVAPVQEPEPPATPEQPALSVEELKKRAFSARETDTVQDVSEVRSVALDGAEDVFVEVEAKPVDAQQDLVKSFENAIRPYRQYIYFLVAFLAFIVVALTGMVMYKVYQKSHPVVVATYDPNLPHPVALVLPGGLNFNLGTGTIKDGKWNPLGPEWLQGTEICRWVAIPWNTQMEAVIRTFTQNDTIEIVMNNNDKLTFTVYSIQEMTLEQMQALDQNKPCLLLVLAKQDSDARWVVTALP